MELGFTTIEGFAQFAQIVCNLARGICSTGHLHLWVDYKKSSEGLHLTPE